MNNPEKTPDQTIETEFKKTRTYGLNEIEIAKQAAEETDGVNLEVIHSGLKNSTLGVRAWITYKDINSLKSFDAAYTTLLKQAELANA